MTLDITRFLNSLGKISSSRLKTITSDEMVELCILTDFLQLDPTPAQRIKALLLNVSEHATCKICDKHTSYVSSPPDVMFKNTCSIQCGIKLRDSTDNHRNSIIEAKRNKKTVKEKEFESFVPVEFSKLLKFLEKHKHIFLDTSINGYSYNHLVFNELGWSRESVFYYIERIYPDKSFSNFGGEIKGRVLSLLEPNNCKTCNKKIPYRMQFCDQKCSAINFNSELTRSTVNEILELVEKQSYTILEYSTIKPYSLRLKCNECSHEFEFSALSTTRCKEPIRCKNCNKNGHVPIKRKELSSLCRKHLITGIIIPYDTLIEFLKKNEVELSTRQFNSTLSIIETLPGAYDSIFEYTQKYNFKNEDLFKRIRYLLNPPICKNCEKEILTSRKEGKEHCAVCMNEQKFKNRRISTSDKIRTKLNDEKFTIIVEPESVMSGNYKLQCVNNHTFEMNLGTKTKKSFKHLCPFCYPSNKSKKELKILDFVRSLGHETISGYRLYDTHHSISVDIYIPEFKFAIEFNGDMFHSYGKSEHKKFNNIDRENPNKHLNKLKRCKELGISLYQIREIDWDLNEELICDNIIGYLTETKTLFNGDINILTDNIKFEHNDNIVCELQNINDAWTLKHINTHYSIDDIITKLCTKIDLHEILIRTNNEIPILTSAELISTSTPDYTYVKFGNRKYFHSYEVPMDWVDQGFRRLWNSGYDLFKFNRINT